MFLVNSRSPRFTSTSHSSWSKSTHQERHTFSRSYGVNLQSSLTRVLSSALGFSPNPPVSVYGTAICCLKLRGFSREPGINHFGPVGPRHHASGLTDLRIFLEMLPTRLNRAILSRLV